MRLGAREVTNARVRFLVALCDREGITNRDEFAERVQKAGGQATGRAASKWLEGGGISPDNLPAVALALGEEPAAFASEWARLGLEPAGDVGVLTDESTVRRIARDEYLRLERQRLELLPRLTEFSARRGADQDDEPELLWLSILAPAAAARRLQDVTAEVDEIDKSKPPAKYAAQIGEHGFALQVEGMSMAGYTRDDGTPDYILPGFWVWVNPEHLTHTIGLVVASVERDNGSYGAVLKYHAGGGRLYGEQTPGERKAFDARVIEMTPVICITSERGQ